MTANQVQDRGKVSPYLLVMYHAWPRHANPARVIILGAMCAGMKVVRYFMRGDVILCVMDLSRTFSFHWEKVRFSAGVRNSSSHPSLVRFWRGTS